jgi:hypothetical protein
MVRIKIIALQYRFGCRSHKRGGLHVQVLAVHQAFECPLAVAQRVLGNDDGLQAICNACLGPQDLYLGPLSGLHQTLGRFQLRLG